MSSELKQDLNQLGSKDQPLELLLSASEHKILEKLLPPGYTLVPYTRITGILQHKPAVIEEPYFPVPQPIKTEKPKRKAYVEAEQTIKGANEGFKKSSKTLALLKRNENAGPFLEPVDPIALGILTYFTVIKHPMDLSLVEFKLKNEEYDTPQQFIDDVRLIWNNALTFNPVGSEVYNMAEDMSIFFEDLLKREDEGENMLKFQTDKLKKKLKDIEEGVTKRSHRGPFNKTSNEKPLSYQEKKNLSNMIKSMPHEHLYGVWTIVIGSEGNRNNEELEFDLDILPTRVCRDLEKYVKSKMSHLQRKQKSLTKNENTEQSVNQFVFREDTRSSDLKIASSNDKTIKLTNVSNINTQDGNTLTGQSSFKIDLNLRRDESSESSFISDLDKSD